MVSSRLLMAAVGTRGAGMVVRFALIHPTFQFRMSTRRRLPGILDLIEGANVEWTNCLEC